MKLVLFQRDDCPLCDEAIAMLATAHAPDFECRWIDGDAPLEARYGTRVPVLCDEQSGGELDWPFDAVAIERFVATLLHRA